jgi:hypothetical protein
MEGWVRLMGFGNVEGKRSCLFVFRTPLKFSFEITALMPLDLIKAK